jgi:hypothetical protein
MWRIGVRRIVLLSICMTSLSLGGCDTMSSSADRDQRDALYQQQRQREREAAWHAELDASLAQSLATTPAPEQPPQPTDPAPEQPPQPTNPVLGQQPQHIAGWLVYCTVDRVYDKRGCLGIKDQLRIGWHAPGMPYVTVARDRERAPKNAMVVRVDGHTPFSTYYKGWSDAEATQIITQLLQGHFVLVRYRAWPVNQIVEQEISLEGIREAWSSMQAWVKER